MLSRSIRQRALKRPELSSWEKRETSETSSLASQFWFWWKFFHTFWGPDSTWLTKNLAQVTDPIIFSAAHCTYFTRLFFFLLQTQKFRANALEAAWTTSSISNFRVVLLFTSNSRWVETENTSHPHGDFTHLEAWCHSHFFYTPQLNLRDGGKLHKKNCMAKGKG